MNYWAKRTVTLHLSQRGTEALAAVFDTASVEVTVEWADELGLWIFRERADDATTTVMLVRWEHFETAILDVVILEPEQPKLLGFRKSGQS